MERFNYLAIKTPTRCGRKVLIPLRHKPYCDLLSGSKIQIVFNMQAFSK